MLTTRPNIKCIYMLVSPNLSLRLFHCVFSNVQVNLPDDQPNPISAFFPSIISFGPLSRTGTVLLFSVSPLLARHLPISRSALQSLSPSSPYQTRSNQNPTKAFHLTSTTVVWNAENNYYFFFFNIIRMSINIKIILFCLFQISVTLACRVVRNKCTLQVVNCLSTLV